ncbi:MAG: hypothetical protein ABIO55_07580 [Ginsengibacter sp.]
MAEINNSKETIKNRMLKHALNYWSIKNTEDLDPIVKLILEALSAELYNLGNEIKDTQVRILEKIANLLAPEFLTSANPAHALMHVSPAEPTELLTGTTNFYTQRKISSKQNEILDTNLEIFFTPVDNIEIFDAAIAYLISGNSLFTYDQSFNKQLFGHTIKGKLIESNTLWLGLNINKKIESIPHLFFCFDWKNIEPQLSHRTYQLLRLAKWYIDDKELKIIPGLKYHTRGDIDRSGSNAFLDNDFISLMEKDIKNHYENKFITITDEGFNNLNKLKQPYPLSFNKIFSDSDLQKLNEKLLWLKIVFPAGMQQESLDEVYVYLNTLPVMNRQLNELKYRLKGNSNIIPLRTSVLEQFLSVKSLSDETRQYQPVPYRKKDEEESGTYTLRNGGVERFDSRNAKEFISYLLELLRSESSAFSAYGYDFIATTLKEMNQRMALMEEKTMGLSNSATEIPNYIIVKPFEGNDIMYAEYWTTLADAANNLRSGTRLQQVSGVKVKPDSIFLLTTTIGGKNRLRPEERLNAFRYGMMTRNRIITKEDIRNFCFYEMGSRINEVLIERGIEMSPHAKEAFKRTIDITIIPFETETLGNAEWQLLSDQLKTKLEARSGMSNHYKIMVNSKR